MLSFDIKKIVEINQKMAEFETKVKFIKENIPEDSYPWMWIDMEELSMEDEDFKEFEFKFINDQLDFLDKGLNRCIELANEITQKGFKG